MAKAFDTLYGDWKKIRKGFKIIRKVPIPIPGLKVTLRILYKIMKINEKTVFYGLKKTTQKLEKYAKKARRVVRKSIKILEVLKRVVKSKFLYLVQLQKLERRIGSMAIKTNRFLEDFNDEAEVIHNFMKICTNAAEAMNPLKEFSEWVDEKWKEFIENANKIHPIFGKFIYVIDKVMNFPGKLIEMVLDETGATKLMKDLLKEVTQMEQFKKPIDTIKQKLRQKMPFLDDLNFAKNIVNNVNKRKKVINVESSDSSDYECESLDGNISD